MSKHKIYNIGINDSDKPVKINGKHTKYYLVWRSMISRCYNKNYHKCINYADCKVCDEWLLFSNFKSWMEQQDWEGKQLDKDLLLEGNRVYSPLSCVFVTSEINKFLTLRQNFRGELPIGVSKISKSSNYQATEGNIYLGSYPTPELAHDAWKKAKLNTLNRLLDKEENERVRIGLSRVKMKLINAITHNQIVESL